MYLISLDNGQKRYNRVELPRYSSLLKSNPMGWFLLTQVYFETWSCVFSKKFQAVDIQYYLETYSQED